MNKPVTACIINTRTGEISDAITHSDSTPLRLKVRDVLNPEHGKYAFRTVEFGMTVFSLKRLLEKLAPGADTTPIKRLSFEYRLHSQQKLVDASEAEYKLAVDAKKDVEARYADNIPMQNLLADLLTDEIVERANEVNAAKSELRTLQARLETLQPRAA